MTSRGQCPRGGGACECLDPPPFRKSCIRACMYINLHDRLCYGYNYGIRNITIAVVIFRCRFRLAIV